ncbi:unnamed protein product, partial [marine sediment metagenome]
AYIQFTPTPGARPRSEKAETSGMVLMAAVPVWAGNEEIIGILYGGILLNRNYRLVDYVRDMVFEEKEYKGKPFGTVTIFQWDVRITTNVKEKDGSRAIGTRVSREVYEKVLENGKTWLDRAFVVNSWYISAYEPIYAPTNKIIGMLYAGVLEDKYVDIKNGIFLRFLAIIFGWYCRCPNSFSSFVPRTFQTNKEAGESNQSYCTGGNPGYSRKREEISLHSEIAISGNSGAHTKF